MEESQIHLPQRSTASPLTISNESTSQRSQKLADESERTRASQIRESISERSQRLSPNLHTNKERARESRTERNQRMIRQRTHMRKVRSMTRLQNVQVVHAVRSVFQYNPDNNYSEHKDIQIGNID